MGVLTKKFRFETAHRLAKGYEGKCANIHGHSWNGELAIEYQRLDKFDMGLDYGEMGKFLKKIEDKFDHKLLLWKGDEAVIRRVNVITEVVLTADNPTSEHIAQVIFNEAFSYFSKFAAVSIKSVTIKETCTTSCVVEERNNY